MTDPSLRRPTPIREIVRMTSQNVCCLPRMPLDHVKYDVTQTARTTDVVFWQEIVPADYAEVVDSLNPGIWATWWADGKSSGCPVSWRKEMFDFVEGGHELLHEGEKGICGPRYIVWALLRSKVTGALVVFSSRHYVANAWNRNPKFILSRSKRRKMWNEGNARDRVLIEGWIEKGYAVAIGGDFNRQRTSALPFGEVLGHRRVHYLNDPHSIDYVILISNAYWVWQDLHTEALPDRYSDHNGRRGTARLGARSGQPRRLCG